MKKIYTLPSGLPLLFLQIMKKILFSWLAFWKYSKSLRRILSIYIFIKSFSVILLYLSQFTPLPSSIHPTLAPTINTYTIVPCLWFVHICSLSSPCPFLPPLSPSPLPSGHCQSVPHFRACGSIFFISLFCPLGSSSKWDHMVFVFYYMAYFT